MEDILTSNVFGALKYLQPNEGLLPFLAHARAGGSLPFADFVGRNPKITYQKFWPWHEQKGCNGCEPDVEIHLQFADGKKFIFFIEAKYRSGKSSEECDEEVLDAEPKPPIDQLAREWHNLILLAKERGATPKLVYLTAGVENPHKDIEASSEAFASKCPGDVQAFDCAWLSWRHLAQSMHKSSGPIQCDVLDMLEKLNLTFYRGIPHFPQFTVGDWRFETERHAIQRNKVPTRSDKFGWSFDVTLDLNWRFSA